MGAARGLMLASGRVWEYVGGPGCTRLISEAAERDSLLTIRVKQVVLAALKGM